VVRHGDTVQERSGVALSFCRRPDYWGTVGWCKRRCKCKCRSVRECRRDMSLPCACPTPYHPVILAQARIHTCA